MNRELDLQIAKEVYGWNTYIPVAPDYYGENAGKVLVESQKWADDLFANGYSYPRKGAIPEYFFVPAYTSDLRLAILLAQKVKMNTPISSLPLCPKTICEMALQHYRAYNSQQSNTTP